MNRRIIALAAALACCITAAAQPSIKVLQGVKDTVTTSSVDLIFQTAAPATASINDVEVPVYRTGAFGKRYELEPGANVIKVKVNDGSADSELVLKTFYKKVKSTPKPAVSPTKPAFKSLVKYVETVEGAYLQYGNGSDRLGGSRIGTLDEGIVLKTLGTEGNLYKVELSDNRFAYIHKEDVKDSKKTTWRINSKNTSVYNAGAVDIVALPLDFKLPYASWTEIDPMTICVDVYGAMNNTNWITQKQGLEMIEWVDLRQVDSDVLRIVIRLKQKYSWGYSVGYERNSLVVRVKHTPSLELSSMTFGLDAGHGGKAAGAISITGIKEKDVNLTLVKLVQQRLEERGAKVVLSRPDDSAPSMTERKKTFKDADIDLMLSIHNNAGGSPFVPMGTSTYYKHIANRDLAACVRARMLELGVNDYGMVGNFNFSLCQPTDYPAVLLEAMFMSSLVDEDKLADPEFRDQVADKVIAAIEDYLKIVKESLK